MSITKNGSLEALRETDKVKLSIMSESHKIQV